MRIAKGVIETVGSGSWNQIGSSSNFVNRHYVSVLDIGGEHIKKLVWSDTIDTYLKKAHQRGESVELAMFKGGTFLRNSWVVCAVRMADGKVFSDCDFVSLNIGPIGLLICLVGSLSVVGIPFVIAYIILKMLYVWIFIRGANPFR